MINGNFFDFDMGVAMLSEVDESGFIGIQVDAYGEERSGVETYETHFPLGMYGRPVDPEKDPNGEPLPASACTTLYAHEGGQGHAWPLQDPRVILKLPKCKEGGMFFPSPVPGCGFAMWDGIDENDDTKRPGSFTLLVRCGPDSSKSHLLSFDVRTEGKETIKLAHAKGHGAELHYDGSVRLFNSKGSQWVRITDDQIVLNGVTHAQGSMSVGDSKAAQALVLAEPLFAYLEALEAALLAITPTPPAIAMKIAAVKKLMQTRTLTAS